MAPQTLTLNLSKDIPTDPSTASAILDNSVRIPNLSSSSSSPTCRTILPSLQGDPSLVTNFNIPAVLENLQTFKNALKAPKVLITDTFNDNDAATLSTIKTYLTSLRTVDYPTLQFVANCAVEGTISADPLDLQEQKQVTEESKSRLAAISAPETHVSYYESWFPRPMKEDALFGLFGTALFLLLVCVAFFLGMSGIEFQILAPTWVFPMIDFSILTSRTPVLIAGVGAGLILGVVGHYLKWF